MIRLALRSLQYYWRANLGVFAGTLLASAVLTGALLVGDSVDYSLRTFAMSRLGGIHFAQDSRTQYVHQDFAGRLEGEVETEVAAALHLRGMGIYQGDEPDDRARVNKVDVFGVEHDFWSIGNAPPLELGCVDGRQ